MKTVFINNYRGEDLYGIELWMLRMSRALMGHGHQIWLACRPSKGLWLAAQREKVPVIAYDPCKGLDWVGVRQIRCVAQGEKLDAVCVKTYNDLRVAALACRGLPLRLFCRRGAMHDVKNNVRHFFHLAVLKPEILVPSAALKRDFLRIRWMNSKRLHVLHHGLDAAHYQAPNVIPVAQGGVVFVGRLCFDKGVDVLLEAWAQVIRQIRGVSLVVVGGGDQVAYAAQAQVLNIADRVVFAGYQADVRPWLKEAALLVLPSRREGAGYVLIEAMATGLPVVASALESIAEYVKDGKTGLLVPPADAAALAAAILKVLKNRDLGQRMGAAGLQRVRNVFSLATTVQRLEGLFEPQQGVNNFD